MDIPMYSDGLRRKGIVSLYEMPMSAESFGILRCLYGPKGSTELSIRVPSGAKYCWVQDSRNTKNTSKVEVWCSDVDPAAGKR